MVEEIKDGEAARTVGREDVDFDRYTKSEDFQAIIGVFEGLHSNKESNKLNDDQIMNYVIDLYYDRKGSYEQMDDKQKENARRELAERINKFEEVKVRKEAEQANAPISQKLDNIAKRVGLTEANTEKSSYAAAAAFFNRADKEQAEVVAAAEENAKYASEAAALEKVLKVVDALRNDKKLINFNDKQIVAHAVNLYFAGDDEYKKLDDNGKKLAREKLTKRIADFEKMRAAREAGGPSRYEQLSQSVANFSENVRTSVNNFSDKVQSGISGLGEGVRDSVTNFSKEVQDSVAGFNKSVSERIQAGVAALGTAKNNVNDDLSATYDQILQRYKELGNRVQTGVTNFSNGVQTRVTNFSNDVHTSVTNFSNGVRSGVEGLSEGVRNSVTNFSNGVHTSVTNFSTGVQTGVSNLSKEMQASVANFSKELNSKIQAGVATISAAKENAVKGIASAAHYEQITQMCKNLSEGIQTSVTNFSNGVQTSVTNFSNSVHTSVTNLKEGVHEGIAGIKESVQAKADNIKESVTNLGAGVKEGVTNLGTGVKEGVTNLGAGVKEGVTNLGAGVKEGVTNLGAGVKEGVTNLGTGVKESVSNIRKGVGDKLHAGVDGLSAAKNRALEQLFGGRKAKGSSDSADHEAKLKSLYEAVEDVMQDFFVKENITDPKVQASWIKEVYDYHAKEKGKSKSAGKGKQADNAKVNPLVSAATKQGARN